MRILPLSSLIVTIETFLIRLVRQIEFMTINMTFESQVRHRGSEYGNEICNQLHTVWTQHLMALLSI